MAKSNNFSKASDLKGEQKRFTEENFGADNSGGILLFPNTYENPQQIKSEPFIINAAQMAAIKENVFDYFGCNEDILQNKAIGDAWSAYYEGKIEPFALQMSLVMTNMTFTQREISGGNQVYFTANRGQAAFSRHRGPDRRRSPSGGGTGDPAGRRRAVGARTGRPVPAVCEAVCGRCRGAACPRGISFIRKNRQPPDTADMLAGGGFQ